MENELTYKNIRLRIDPGNPSKGIAGEFKLFPDGAIEDLKFYKAYLIDNHDEYSSVYLPFKLDVAGIDRMIAVLEKVKEAIKGQVVKD